MINTLYIIQNTKSQLYLVDNYRDIWTSDFNKAMTFQHLVSLKPLLESAKYFGLALQVIEYQTEISICRRLTLADINYERFR